MQQSELTIALLEKLDQLLSQFVRNNSQRPGNFIDWQAPAFLWRKRAGEHSGHLKPVYQLESIALDSLLNISQQKQQMVRNTEQFLQGLPANNALLWGSRGTGKSTLVRALLSAYASQGLRIIEVEGHDLIDLPDIIDLIREREEKFIVFTDDLSFEKDDPSYKALKSALDGSVASTPDNLIIYATSNRRNLMPALFSDNYETQNLDDEVHPGESVEEKTSLSERFGLWLSFHPFSQNEYLGIVDAALNNYNLKPTSDCDSTRLAAIRWATQRGSRSGRVALQFAKDWLGRQHFNQQNGA